MHARTKFRHRAFAFMNAAVCAFRSKVQALRSVEPYLGLDALYVLGTNCVDNGPREGLDKFLKAASNDPDTVLHYEFMQVGLLSRENPA